VACERWPGGSARNCECPGRHQKEFGILGGGDSSTIYQRKFANSSNVLIFSALPQFVRVNQRRKNYSRRCGRRKFCSNYPRKCFGCMRGIKTRVISKITRLNAKGLITLTHWKGQMGRLVWNRRGQRGNQQLLPIFVPVPRVRTHE